MTFAVLFLLSIFAAQLLRLQGFDAAATSRTALDGRTAEEEVMALRGQIVSSEGTVLAASVERRKVVVDQTAVPAYTKNVDGTRSRVGVKGAAADLAPLLGRRAAELEPLLTGSSRYTTLATNVTPATWRKILELGINGVYSERTQHRSYPQSTASASLVGFVTADNKGGGGVEVMMESDLAGTQGLSVYETARDGRMIPNGRRQITPSVPGKDVRLTISSDLQWYAQQVLATAVQKTQALSGTVVAMRVDTGDLLAVASYPTFDPNALDAAKGSLVNLAFSDVFEPGSTGKIITAAAALEEKKVTPSTPMVVPYSVHRSDTTFKDSHVHPTEYLTFAGALAQSSNTGTILAGERLEPATLEKYLRSFGIGSSTGMGYPGESPGILAKSQDWSGSQRYTVMYGQGLSVTAVQAAGVYQTIANGGVRVPPRLVASVTGPDGRTVSPPVAEGVRVVSTETADQVNRMLEGVVSEEGTAPKARIPGYRVAGKTGTADRYDSRARGYAGKTASFIGFAPADDPQIVVAAILQRPIKGYYGGQVAAPVFKDVMTYALQKLGVPPTGGKPAPVRVRLEGPPPADDPLVLRDGATGAGG